jgi:hypothetical protein
VKKGGLRKLTFCTNQGSVLVFLRFLVLLGGRNGCVKYKIILKNKILIYDASRGYHRFIKMNFKGLEVKSFLEYSNCEDVDFKSFDAVIFIINHPIELVDFICFQEKISPIFLGTNLMEINGKIRKFDKAIFLDLEQSRQEMINFLKFQFKLLGVMEVEVA